MGRNEHDDLPPVRQYARHVASPARVSSGPWAKPESMQGPSEQSASHSIMISTGQATELTAAVQSSEASPPSSFTVRTPMQTRPDVPDSADVLGSGKLLATPSLGSAPLDRNLYSSPGGLSPTKHSPKSTASAVKAGDAGSGVKLTISPLTSLSPYPGLQDPTPPIKPLDPRSSFSH